MTVQAKQVEAAKPHDIHTPSPWCLELRGKELVVASSVVDETDGQRLLIATIRRDLPVLEAIKHGCTGANGRLIQTAPDLYTVAHLVEVLSHKTMNTDAWLTEFRRIADAARAAITKATGGAA